MDAFFFWFFALLMLAAGVGVVLNRNPIASALCLAAAMVATACLFWQLHAFFLGAVQIVVYAGAVMVLFLFIVMLLDLGAEARRRIRWFGLLSGGAVGLFFAVQFWRVLPASPPLAASLPRGAVDDVPALGTLLFGRYVLPFEAVGVLLLVAMLGVVVLSRKGDA